MELPVCRWRGNRIPSSNGMIRHACTSPKLLVSAFGVTSEICVRCPYADHEPQEVAVKDRRGSQISLPTCIHLGDVAPIAARPDTLRDWRECQRSRGIVCQCQQCNVCPERQAIEPRWVRRIDFGLSKNDWDHTFNGSLISFHGQLLLAYRYGYGGGFLRLAVLDAQFRILSDRALELKHPHCGFAQEDPRLFLFREKLHVSFCGVETIRGHAGVHILIAELSDTFEVGRVWYPHYAHRTEIEKNWVFFDHAQQLYAIYLTAPNHQILRVQQNAILAYSTPTHSIWQGGHIRGGAAPVLHRGRWYHWFHGWKQTGSMITYSIGCLTFEDGPPFRVLQMTSIPLMGAIGGLTPGRPPESPASVIFPLGAFLEESTWVVSYGLHDAFVEVAAFDADEVETQLVSIV